MKAARLYELAQGLAMKRPSLFSPFFVACPRLQSALGSCNTQKSKSRQPKCEILERVINTDHWSSIPALRSAPIREKSDGLMDGLDVLRRTWRNMGAFSAQPNNETPLHVVQVAVVIRC